MAFVPDCEPRRGGTSGSTKADILATDRDNTYVTLFTDAGEEPEIAYNAAEPVDFDSFPQRLSFHGGARFKLDITAVPGTASTTAKAILKFSAIGAA